MSDLTGASPRPRLVCEALLAALDATEGRRRRRKRDTTPDAIGIAIKRDLLEQAVLDDPEPEAFEAWLLARSSAKETAPAAGVAAMARSIFEEWRMAHSLPSFRDWLARGAPSDDVFGGAARGSR